MNIDVVQRWHQRRDLYRPAGEPINPAHYEVAAIRDDRTAKDFVCQHHYSSSYPAARFRYGLYWGGLLVGVAVFSIPMQGAVLDCLPCPRELAVELGRFVLLDRVPANGESWTIARCFELLRKEGIEGVVSFSDPVPRVSTDGIIVSPGHLGRIYRATNGAYLGRSTPRTIRMLPSGHVVSDRALSKIRCRERGWRYAAEQLERAGAAPLSEHADARAWLAEWLPKLTRTIRHPGNLRYGFGLDRAVKKALLKDAQPYPHIEIPKPQVLLGPPR